MSQIHRHLPSPVNYREDINGLRAWAVMAVLFFHFKLIGLPGGFAGVDIFFVISGYLMTAIIVGGHEKGSFSIWKFYMSRIRRILPALLVMIAVLLAVGWFWLPTADYQALGKQSEYSLTFLSNIGYWRSAGYFDSAAEEKWLLHTWSLAVEAQFYVVYPIFVALVWRWFKGLKAITIALLVVLIASLSLSVFGTQLKPTAAFYLLPTRGWELAAGGLVYLIAKQGLASISAIQRSYWLGWILVFASFFFITKHLAWPGYWAILPVLGTSLIILGQREKCKLTDNTVAQWLGDRSYSLYLWHWPLVVTLYFTGLQGYWSWVIGSFALSILLAHLSYRFVETPTRLYLSQSKLLKEVIVLVSTVFLLGTFSILVHRDGFENRGVNASPQALYLAQFAKNSDWDKFERYEVYFNKCNFYSQEDGYKRDKIAEECVSERNESVFLWGDSHAQALSYGLRRFLDEHYSGVGFSQVATAGCRPHLTKDNYLVGERQFYCDKSNLFALNEIKRVKPKLVVMTQRDKHEENNLIEIAEVLRGAGVENVLIVGPLPEWNIDLPRLIARRYWQQDGAKIDDPNFETRLLETDPVMNTRVADLGNEHILYISPVNVLCNSTSNCVAILDSNMTPLAFDYGHLTKEGSVYVVENVLAPIIKKIFGQKGSE